MVTQEYEDIKISEFNSAAFKMRRLDKLFTEMNEINSNLIAFNHLKGVYNYELKFNLCLQVFQEVESKLTTDERLESKALINALNHILTTTPIHENKKSLIYPYNEKVNFNKERFNIIKSWLFKLESLVRKLIDVHGMDTQYKEDVSSAMLR